MKTSNKMLVFSMIKNVWATAKIIMQSDSNFR